MNEPIALIERAPEYMREWSCNGCGRMPNTGGGSFLHVEVGSKHSTSSTRYCPDCAVLFFEAVSKFKPEHIGGRPMHPWDCPACVYESALRRRYRATHNPHRAGTKVAAQWDRDRAAVDHAMDMRSETYWSM